MNLALATVWSALPRTLPSVLLVLVVLAVTVSVTLGAEPSGGPLAESGDLRAEGEGPGLVGSPLLILVGVIALGLVTAVVTVLAFRLSQRR